MSAEDSLSRAVSSSSQSPFLSADFLSRKTLSAEASTLPCNQYPLPNMDSCHSFGSEWVRNPDGKPLLDHNNKPIPVAKLLATKPLRSELATRPGPGNKKLTYMSGDSVTRTLNDIFGFDGWCLEIKATNREECVKDDKGRFHVAYTATVRVTHRRSGAFKEDCGAGDSIDKSLGTAVGHALKASVTDAMKRAVRHFGDKLGNSLYQGTFNLNKAPASLKDALDMHEVERANSKFGFDKDRKKSSVPTASQNSFNSISTLNTNHPLERNTEKQQVYATPTASTRIPTELSAQSDNITKKEFLYHQTSSITSGNMTSGEDDKCRKHYGQIDRFSLGFESLVQQQQLNSAKSQLKSHQDLLNDEGGLSRFQQKCLQRQNGPINNYSKKLIALTSQEKLGKKNLESSYEQEKTVKSADNTSSVSESGVSTSVNPLSDKTNTYVKMSNDARPGTSRGRKSLSIRSDQSLPEPSSTENDPIKRQLPLNSVQQAREKVAKPMTNNPYQNKNGAKYS